MSQSAPGRAFAAWCPRPARAALARPTANGAPSSWPPPREGRSCTVRSKAGRVHRPHAAVGIESEKHPAPRLRREAERRAGACRRYQSVRTLRRHAPLARCRANELPTRVSTIPPVDVRGPIGVDAQQHVLGHRGVPSRTPAREEDRLSRRLGAAAAEAQESSNRKGRQVPAHHVGSGCSTGRAAQGRWTRRTGATRSKRSMRAAWTPTSYPAADSRIGGPSSR